jgi:hypothetical protein
MVLGEELDLRGQGGTIRKLRVSSTRYHKEGGGSVHCTILVGLSVPLLPQENSISWNFVFSPMVRI